MAKIREVHLKQFKRFHDLTIDLGENPARVVAMVGPNGCGKSSVFDAFEEKLKLVKGAQQREPDWFFDKLAFHPNEALKNRGYDREQAITLRFAEKEQAVSRRTFHIRSAYRFTSGLDVQNISAQPNILDDNRRPHSSVALDGRLRENYERLLGLAYEAFDRGEKTGSEIKNDLLGVINGVLGEVIGIRVSSIGNVTEGRGQLYFEKEDARNFPYQNLSSGEKEVVDLVVDLIVRAPEYNDTVYCIDEPELHLSTAVQRKLLVALERLVPENWQLLVATHSIGFLRALQEDLATKCAVLDFSERDYFSTPQTIRPVTPTRANWQRIFQTALDDLVGLLAPKRIVYCEGKPEPSDEGQEQGLDAFVYNEIFGAEHPATLFVSSGGANDVRKVGSLAIKVLGKALLDVEILLLHDRDGRTETERDEWLAEALHHRMLRRREIENYLFDFAVLHDFCESNGRSISREDYDSLVSDPFHEDFKVGQTILRLKALCEKTQDIAHFKRTLARHLGKTSVLTELREDIFPSLTSNEKR